MKNAPKITNAKKGRRVVRAELKRVMSVEEIVHYANVALLAGASEVASRILGLRGEVTVEEVAALMQLARLEVEARKAGYCG